MARRLVGGVAAVVLGLAWGCQGGKETSDPEPLNPGVTETPDSGAPDGGSGEESPPGGRPENPSSAAGPWPLDALVNYTQRYDLGAVQSVGVDEGYNIWLLDGARIGTLKPGANAPVWAENVGQAGRGYPSTVICGGAAGKAYVGYRAEDIVQPLHAEPRFHTNFIFDRSGCNFWEYTDCDPGRYSQERWDNYSAGDLDLVRLDDASGRAMLETHLHKSWGLTGDGTAGLRGPDHLGLHNTNDWHFDEDRSVFSCVRVMKGEDKGELYIGSNHGVTRVKGDLYNAHRHANSSRDTGSLIGYVDGLAIAPNNDVLVGNAWMLGVHIPSRDLAEWDVEKENGPTRDRHIAWVNAFGTPTRENKANWRAIAQTLDGSYYAGSSTRGLFKIRFSGKSDADAEQVPGLPQDIRALAATDDGALFIGGAGGLWRMDAAKSIAKVTGVSGSVKQLVYDSTVTPSMLYILTTGGMLYVLRGS